MRLGTAVACLLVPVALGMAGGCRPAVPPERIVLIVIDTLRRDHVGAYGAATPTTNIDRLATGGTRFDAAVSSFHNTSMSMGAMFTGLTPSLEADRQPLALPWNAATWCGLSRFAAKLDDPCVPGSVPILGELMHARGYWVLGVTPHPLLFRPLGFDRGFDRWVQVEGASRQHRGGYRAFARARAGTVVNAAVAAALDSRPTDRFFLYVHYLDAHDWWMAGVPYAYAVQQADAAVGELLGLLEARNLLEGTAVVLTSDHGEALGEPHFVVPSPPKHVGNPAFEEVLRVPLIVAGAEVGHGRREALRSQDVLGLLAAMAGGDHQQTWRDLEPGELFLTERRFRTYRAGRWKSFWKRDTGAFALVDLASDPGELQDVAADHPAVAEAHRLRVAALTARLATSRRKLTELAPEDRQRLRVLGYLEDE